MPDVTIDALIERYPVLLFDAFGVLIHGSGPLDGAAGLIDRLNGIGKPYYILTNDASKLEATAARTLQDYGLDVPPERIIPSGALLARHFASHNLAGARTAVLGPADSAAFVERAGGRVVPPTEPFEVLVIGDESGFPFLETVDAVLSALIARLDRGEAVHLVLPNPDLIYPKADRGFGIASGSLALLFEAALALRYPDRPPARFVRLGKPYPAIFEEAARRSGTRDMVMLGDQLETDIRGANAFGIPSVLVATGVSGPGTTALPAALRPTYRLASLASRPAAPAGAFPEPIASIKNFAAISSRLATAGQPSEAQIRALAQDGFEAIVNLGLLDPRYCLPDEAGLVRSLGLAYHHIPVDFQAPAATDLERFFAVMRQEQDRKLFVHCAANYRVSSFLALYGQARLGWSQQEADAHIRRVWEPNPTWAAFIAASRSALGLRDSARPAADAAPPDGREEPLRGLFQEDAMIAPTAIDHICLVVTSLAASRDYYRRLFDFTFAPREGDPDTLAVESGAVHFFLTQVPGAPPDFLRRQHLSFRVADLDDAIARLAAAGVAEYATGRVDFFRRNNYRWCEWRDPDGIRLECVQPL